MSDDLLLSGVPTVVDLLQVLEFNPRHRRTTPLLMMEFEVNPDTAPFLVTGTRTLQWVTPRGPRLRAAVRPFKHREDLYREIVAEVGETGAEADWGNVQPFTPEGLLLAINHVRFYGLIELEILAHPQTDLTAFKVSEGRVAGYQVHHVPWLDPQTLLVLPVDRAFVGFLALCGEGRVLAVVHNASRGLGLVR